MAEAPLQLELCAPEHMPVTIEATEVVVPGAAGIFTVLPGHTALLSALGAGVVIVQPPEGEKEFYAVHRGFVEVIDDRIMVLADRMERGEDIDPERARSALARAAEGRQASREPADIRDADAAWARATARLQAHEKGEY